MIPEDPTQEDAAALLDGLTPKDISEGRLALATAGHEGILRTLIEEAIGRWCDQTLREAATKQMGFMVLRYDGPYTHVDAIYHGTGRPH